MTTINPLAAALAALFDQSLQAAVTSSRELDENEVRDLVGRVMAPTVDRLDGRIDSHVDRLDGRIDSQAQTITELLDRVAALEARVTDVTAQLARALLAAETGHAAASQAGLEARLAALEAAPDLQRFDDELAYLTSRVSALEAAPAGLQRFADGRPITAESIREIAEAAAEAALDEHCESYDHDGYDAHVNDDDKHPEGDLEEKVREVIDGLEITLSL
jgi:uncharacterized coiled-coil protein SlyX